MSRRERTGYYDRKGKAICNGDRIKAIIGGQIVRGEVEVVNGEWCLLTKAWPYALWCLDDVEILEGDE